MRALSLMTLASLFVAAGCDRTASTPPEPAPVVVAVATEDPEPPPPESFTAGTFYLEWFFDERDERSKLANEKNAATAEDFEWKMKSVAKILMEADLDIVALQSVGTDREVRALVTYMMDNDGPEYDFKILETKDRMTSQNVAVLSKFPMYSARQLDITLNKQLVVDISLPDDEEITVVTAMLRAGNYSSQKKRRIKQAKDLRKQVLSLSEQQPVLVLGDIGSNALPDEKDYKYSAPAILAGVHNKDENDDCEDSAGWIEAQDTTVKDETRDRMVLCGLEAESFEVVGADEIVRGEVDPAKIAWSAVALEERDLSDHYLLRSTITLPSIVTARKEAEAEEQGGDAVETAAP